MAMELSIRAPIKACNESFKGLFTPAKDVGRSIVLLNYRVLRHLLGIIQSNIRLIAKYSHQ